MIMISMKIHFSLASFVTEKMIYDPLINNNILNYWGKALGAASVDTNSRKITRVLDNYAKSFSQEVIVPITSMLLTTIFIYDHNNNDNDDGVRFMEY